MRSALAIAATLALTAQHAPPPDPHRHIDDLGDFRLESGVTLPHATRAYATSGTLNAQRDNAILIP